MSTVLVLAVGALCGSFINGLAGFGTGLTTLGLWLHVVSPPWLKQQGRVDVEDCRRKLPSLPCGVPITT